MPSSRRYRNQNSPSRPKKTRPLKRYLIISEDSKSSLDYLLRFPVDKKQVEIVPEGGAGNTINVVRKGIKLQKEATRAGNPFIHVYCVFDRDSFPQQHYQQAFDEAQKHNDLTAIWANECFELWYLLHFAYHDTRISRRDLVRRLEAKSRLGHGYQKNDPKIYNKLESRLETALQHADKLLYEAEKRSPKGFWNENPSTNIQVVVRKLQELQELKDL